MIFVDSSVWIDYFRGTRSRNTDFLDSLLGKEPVIVGDLVLTEVLQGFQTDPGFKTALRLLTSFEIVQVGGEALAIAAAKNYRHLRRRGITVRKTIDTLIATCCIESGHQLLSEDRDFTPFLKWFNLEAALQPPSPAQ